MLKKDEGFVGQNPQTLKSAHPKTSSDYGAYYDSKGYLTTGFGSLISKNKKGSPEEAADIAAWTGRTQYDPFTLTNDQASEILPNDIDRVTARAKKQLGDVDFETLPEPCQQAVVSLAYNAGQIGENTAAAIRKAATTKSTKDWQKCASMFENWHGNKTAEQPNGVIARRKREASLVGSIEGLFLEGSDSETPDNYVETPVYDGELPEAVNRSPVSATPEVSEVTQPAINYVDPQGRITNKPMDTAQVVADAPLDQSLQNTPFAQTAFDQKQAIAKQDTIQTIVDEADSFDPFMSLGKFGEHLNNTFMTENIIGSGIKRAALNWNVDETYEPGFDASKIPGFPELVKGIPPEDLKNILNESLNREQFAAKVLSREIESQARAEIGQYMSTNPVSGFVGIGVASVLDVTSLIPVGKLASFVGMTRVAKNIPMVVKTIGGAVSENLIQDLTQEAFLVNNSDIRKWDDGDVMYGAIGSAVLGGAAGTFKYSKGLSKYEKLASKYTNEKNLSAMEVMIRNAKKKGYSAKIITNLEQTKAVIEQSLESDHRAMIINEMAHRQELIGKGLLDTKKVEIIKEQLVINKSIDEQIVLERAKPNPIASAIQDVKGEAKAAKAEASKPIVKLRDENIVLSKKINSLKKQVEIAGPESKAQAKLDSLLKKRELNNTRIEELSDAVYRQQKKFKGEKNRAVKAAQKAIDPREEQVKHLENMKQSTKELLQEEYDELNDSILDGSHPELQIVRGFDSANEIAKSLGLDHLQFNSIDDVDRFLGLKFEDSLDEFTGPAKSGGAAAVEYTGFTKGGSTDAYFNKTDPDLWNVMSQSAYEARSNPALGLSSHQVNKNGVYARILRATRLNEFLTSDSIVGRFILNKNSIRSTKNEFAASFYNIFAPDGVGRAGAGKFSLMEKQQQLSNIYVGTLRKYIGEGLSAINDEALQNPALRKALDLPENNVLARVYMAEVGHVEKVADKLLRDELIEPGTIRRMYGDKAGDIVEKMSTQWDKISNDVLTRAKEAGVKGVDEIDSGANTKGWFHRTWDNNAVRQFYARHGEANLIKLVDNSMIKHLSESGVEITEEVSEQIASQAKKFAFGIRNSDLEVNRAANMSTEDFLQSLINKNLDGVDADALRTEMSRVADRAKANAAKELGKRKPLNLNGSVQLDDGTEFYMKDLLEKNVLSSQKSYLEGMSARIAAAEAGIKDTALLKQWVDNAVELEMSRGNKAAADYIRRSMEGDIKAFTHGSAGMSGEIDKGTSVLLRMAKKYQFAKVMQYTGISSIAEMGTLIPEAGYRAVSQALTGELTKISKAMLFGGVTGKEYTSTLYDSLSGITGVGIEDIGYDSLVSSSKLITQTPLGNKFERVVDNAAKATRRATAHVEVIGRRLAVNSLALNFGDIALGRSKVDNLLGGLSNRNLVELGLAELDEVTGKAVPNESWHKIIDSIKKHALDEDGNSALTSGKNIKDFNIEAWELKTRRTFGDALTQQANHIVVNPDSTTAALWHTTPLGSIFNQFRSFSNNAASKVAGHNVNQALQGYRMGSLAEASKTAQKYFWGAALGKLSLMLYGAIDNAGRPDFSERMEKYTSMDDPRDWTRALGRSSAITGLDEALDTTVGVLGVDPFFNNSTIGQSRNRLDLGATPTGQLVTDGHKLGEYVLDGQWNKAGKKALKLSPIRRQLGVNQLLNSMGVE